MLDFSSLFCMFVSDENETFELFSLFHSARLYSHFRRILNLTIQGMCRWFSGWIWSALESSVEKPSCRWRQQRGEVGISPHPRHIPITSSQATQTHTNTDTHTHRPGYGGVQSDNRQADLALHWSRCSKKSRVATRGPGLLCLWTVTLHHEGKL